MPAHTVKMEASETGRGIPMKNRLLSFALSLVILCQLFPFSAVASSSLGVEQLCRNFTDCMADGSLSVFAVPRNNYSFDSNMSHLRTDTDETMYFSTVKYNVNDFVKLTDHLARTLAMATVYNTTTDADLKERLGNIIPALIGYWVKNDYQSDNWWYNEINTPNLLGEIALLVKNELSPELMKNVLAIVGDGCFTVNTDLQQETGANAVWAAYSTLKYGMLANEEAAVNCAVSKFKSVLGYSDGEGIKADGSFMQHGARLYSGAYGISLIQNTASILRILQGTSYALDESQLNPLSDMIVNGLQYLSVGNQIDPQTIGRDVSKKGKTNIEHLGEYIKKLLTLDAFPNKPALRQYLNSIEQNTRRNLGLKYFDNAKFLVINNDDFYFSFRGAASNLYYAENLNNENLLSYNSSYGTTTTVAGKTVNYNDIQPIQNYSLIPGTTAVQEDDAALLVHTNYNKRKLTGVFGGADYGDAAVSFAQTTHEGIHYTVACFATDRSAVLLGAGLTNDNGQKMVTTLQQETAQGNFSRNENTVIHNGVKYTVYQGGEMNAQIKTQTGSWKRNNANGSTDAVQGEVFTLTVKNEGSYAYSVMSDSTNDTYTVVENNEDVQAVLMPDGSLCAAFYTDTAFVYGGRIYFGFIGSSIRASAKAVQRSADFVAEHPTVGSFWSTVLSAFSEAYNAIAPLIRRAFD
ncbi:MAG TPA: hypothetical protein DDY98_08820 [Ruminococcaceae bacterium]|nr:hypothetical protein [Oscillospiraceae bacterium]